MARIIEYVVKQGDSLASISRRFNVSAQAIWNASNFTSGTQSIIYPGEVAMIPMSSLRTVPETDLSGVDDTTVTLSIGGNTFTGWSGVSIQRSIEGFAQFAVTAPFDPSRPDIRKAFKPFTYESVELYIGRELIITGIMELIEPTLNANDRSIMIQGRSIPGVLVDCSMPEDASSYDGMSLGELARVLCEPFTITVLDTSGPNGTSGDYIFHDELIPEPGEKIFNYLQKVADAEQKLLTDDNTGRLIISKPSPDGSPVASIVEGTDKIIRATATYDGTKRFSKYIVMSQLDGMPDLVGYASDQSVPAYRPFIKIGSESVIDDIDTAAEQQRSLGIAASMKISMSVIGWHTGKVLWDKGQIVTVKLPSLFIDTDTKMLVSSVKFSLDTSGQITELLLVPPETYTPDLPEDITEDVTESEWMSERY